MAGIATVGVGKGGGVQAFEAIFTTLRLRSGLQVDSVAQHGVLQGPRQGSAVITHRERAESTIYYSMAF
jgi:hypothetical protein